MSNIQTIPGSPPKSQYKVDVTSTTLPDGAATEAKQDDIITELQVINSLVPESFDYIALTYVAAGNGAGEIETVVFKTGGSGGTTVSTLTLAYDADNKLSTVTQS